MAKGLLVTICKGIFPTMCSHKLRSFVVHAQQLGGHQFFQVLNHYRDEFAHYFNKFQGKLLPNMYHVFQGHSNLADLAIEVVISGVLIPPVRGHFAHHFP